MSARVLLAAVALAWLLARPAGAQQQQTGNPHGKLQEECAVCHSPETWVPARVTAAFDHKKHGFVLAGAHGQAACRSCHASLDFKSVPTECVSCHEDVHHGELGADCARCHTARNFLDRATMVQAHQLTRFPLTGAHLPLECEACHTPMPQGRLSFVNLPAQCVDCHLTQFQTAKNPDHVAAAFSSDCSQCHATTIWTAARFNHAATGFPLTGAHLPVACVQCHVGGTFTLISKTCSSCHLQVYTTSTNPNHAGAGFGTTCETCHTTAPGWAPATWTHTWFRVPHASAQCYDCHNVSANYVNFVCTICHTQAQTDPRHASIAGYVWNSNNCYGCHGH